MNSKLEILVLDDEEIVCTRLKTVLEKAGYLAETYTDSRLAKTRIEQHRFDIVVTDLKMANIDGLELFQVAKAKWPDCEVFLITGFATTFKKEFAMSLRSPLRSLSSKKSSIRPQSAFQTGSSDPGSFTFASLRKISLQPHAYQPG